MKKMIFLSAILFLLISPLLGENLVKNPDFSLMSGNMPVSWTASSMDGITVEAEGATSVIHLNNGSSAKYTEISQAIPVDSASVKQITVKARIMVKNIIPGKQEWEMGRVMVLFYDKNNVQVGGWPELGRWKGTTSGWGDKINVINVPDGASSIKLQVHLDNCAGEMWATGLDITPGDSLNIPRGDSDMLMNGDMEFGSNMPLYWGGWLAGEGVFENPGYKSTQCFKITNAIKAYSMITQEITIDPSKVASITVSGYAKVSNIAQGDQNWERARISIEFHDASGALVGGYPPVVGEAAGDSDGWLEWSKDYPVPSGVKTVKVSAGLLNCSGTMWFDKISVTGRDKKGRLFKPEMPKPEDRAGWYPFIFEQDDFHEGAIIDLTGDLDKPAGKHGALVVSENGSFMFEDSTPVRFWGTNLVDGDIFRSHIEIDKMVKRLAKLGVNLVRLHHMDAFWAEPGLIDKIPDDTKTLSLDSLEKLDYLIYKLKDAGIYLFMDMLVHRKPKKGDGIADYNSVPAGFKEVVFFDEKLQDLTKDYITKLLTHENQYTNLAYKDDPAIVLTEIINESSLFYIDRNKEVSPSYIRRLDGLFNNFLKEKYKTMDSLKGTWSKFGDSDLSSSEDFAAGNVQRSRMISGWDDWRKTGDTACSGRAADTKEFYYQLEYVFFHRMYDFIRSLGTKILITGSNHWEKWDADIKANASLDFVDRHTYWDHPSGGWAMQENISFTDLPMLKSKLNCVAELAHARVFKKPFTCSEWNFLIPNEYRAGAPVIMASYAAMNGWDAMLQFNFSNYGWKNNLAHFADFSVTPDFLSCWFPAVRIFREGYVSEGREKIVEYVSEDDMFDVRSSAFKLINNDASTPLLIKSYKTFNPAEEDRQFNPVLKKDAALSLTQQLYWNFGKGIFQVNADKVQGVAGFLNSEKDGFKFKNFRIRSANRYAAVFLTSLDGAPITQSGKLILNLTARIDNSNTKYSPSHTSVIYGGSSPILIEPVYSTCKISTARFKKVKIYSLDCNNYMKEEYRNFTTPDSNTIVVVTDADAKAFNYYIEITR